MSGEKTTASAELDEMIMKSCDLPTIPSVAGRVIKLVSDPSVTANELNKVIMTDVSLAARVLKIANSSFYGCRSTINTVSHAIVVIGFSMIRNIVLAASTKNVYKRYGITEKMLHDHSVGAAMATYLIEKALGRKQSEEAFLAGLFHDIGRVILNNTDPDRFMVVTKEVYNEGRDSTEVEREVFGFSHAEVGSLVLRKWNFSAELEKVIAHHHRLSEMGQDEPQVHQVTAIVNLADDLCYKLGIGLREPQAIDLIEHPAMNILGLDHERMLIVEEELPIAYENERSLFE